MCEMLSLTEWKRSVVGDAARRLAEAHDLPEDVESLLEADLIEMASATTMQDCAAVCERFNLRLCACG